MTDSVAYYIRHYKNYKDVSVDFIFENRLGGSSRESLVYQRAVLLTCDGISDYRQLTGRAALDTVIKSAKLSYLWPAFSPLLSSTSRSVQ